MQPCTTTPAVRFHNYSPSTARIREKILRGLTQRKKELPSFLLYDARGIRLFDRLRRSESYSTARREGRLLRGCANELRRLVGRRSSIVEYGSGTARTAVALLHALPGVTAYVPVDLSLSSLKFGVRRIRRTFADLEVTAVRADFTSCFPMAGIGLRPVQTLVYVSSCAFSTMDVAAATKLLQGAARYCGRRGAVVLGVDLRTNTRAFGRAARSDSLLEAFSLNALEHINRQYAANFHPKRFSHEVVCNEAECRTELQLVSQLDQIVKVDQEKVRLRRGEPILAEARQQYRWQDVEKLAFDSGTKVEHVWFDDERALALVFLRPAW